MLLEALCREPAEALTLPLVDCDDSVLRSDWQPLLHVLGDGAIESSKRAEIFHATMARVILDQACVARQRHGAAQVGLAGGVFQNRILTETVTSMLTANGFEVYLPLALPCNDAALSFGQVAQIAAGEAYGDG